MTSDHVDVLIVGAGLSGIGAGCHLSAKCPQKSFAILEAREAMGGTWDLFRYPGIRSDSDMFTLGYSFRPWLEAKSIADGPSILDYIRDTARDHGVADKVRYNHRVVTARWSSDDALWTVDVERTDTGATEQMTASFLLGCTGYYRYDEGFTPEFEGRERFKGEFIHPQHWPEDLDYAGKRVVIIGSGATAVTLVPAMAKTAGHVTMLQRSPTYVVSLPAEDPFARIVRKVLPTKRAYNVIRWKNVVMTQASYALSQRFPKFMRAVFQKGVRLHLPKDYDFEKHFTPTYGPWDQRVCLVPDADLFKALRRGQASMATDRITTFTETGIELESGETLEADIVISATGLNLEAAGGIRLVVDDEPIDLARTVGYKGLMFSGIPNLAVALGYTNASWTLKCDLTFEYVCRLLNHMDAHDYASVVPGEPGPDVELVPFIDLKSGYVTRSIDKFPRQGDRAPWRLFQSYGRDILLLKRGEIDDGTLEFTKAPRAAKETVAA
ncbi:MAG: flavin-binding family monooxygenase [Solirubrobacterales bacterium]|nr:flavin-binding family monooxygenase [Solirubrobacterales bacterium]